MAKEKKLYTMAGNPNGEMTKMHWTVLATSCLMAWGVMGMLNAYGVFFPPMEKALNAGRAAVTVHYSLRLLVTGLAAPLAASLLERKVSPKKTMPMGIALFLITSLLIVQMKSVLMVDILAVIGGFGLSFISYVFITIILGNWFWKNIGTFTGIAMTFSGIGSAITSPIVTRMMAIIGFERVYVLYAVVTVLLVVPTLFIPFRPEQIGLRPYGQGAPAQLKKKKAEDYLNLPFVLIGAVSITVFLIGILAVGETTLNSHLPSLAIAGGFSAQTGAYLLSASMLGNMTFKLLMGVLIDRLGILKAAAIVLITSTIGYVLILFSGSSALALLLGGYLYGTIFPLGSLGISVLTRYVYGNEQYNQAFSRVTVMTSISSAVFVILFGALYDLAGTYRTTVLAAAGMGLVCLALVLYLPVLCRKKHR